MLEVKSPLSYEEFLRIREEFSEQTELIDGVLYVTPSPSRLHQLVSLRLTRMFDQRFLRSGGGSVYFAPLDFRMGVNSVVQPDLVVVLDDRAHILDEEPTTGSPSIVVEVLSPSTSRKDLSIKRDLYATRDVPEYWIVDPIARTVTIHSNPGNGRYRSVVTSLDVATSVQLPDVSITLEDLFSPYYP
jgi:Uma2 family endonuclease